jgi:hypothetical protein
LCINISTITRLLILKKNIKILKIVGAKKPHLQ